MTIGAGRSQLVILICNREFSGDLAMECVNDNGISGTHRALFNSPRLDTM